MAIDVPPRRAEPAAELPPAQGASSHPRGAAYVGTAPAPPPGLLDFCHDLGIDWRHCWTPRAAARTLGEGMLDVIFVDAEGSEDDALMSCRTLRQAVPSEALPIVIFDGGSPGINRVDALRAGADEIIGPASDAAEARARIQHLLDRKQAIDHARAGIDPLPSRPRDQLTGLDPAGAFQQWLDGEIHRCRRYQRPLAVILIDVDHFKYYNATCGHPRGDALLRRLAQIIQQTIRVEDLAARHGGDEFMIGLPETDRAAAYQVAQRIAGLVAEQPFPGGRCLPLGRVTLSVGVAAVPEDGTAARELLDRLDRALYQAQHGGRDQVVLACPPEAAPEAPAHVLVVDDARTDRMVLAKMLATEPVRVSLAGTGRQALDLIQHDRPDLIFLDALMPEMDGFEVCRRLKQDIRTQSVPIVMVTGIKTIADRVHGLSCGADDYISKPVHRTQLLARTQSLLLRKRYTDRLDVTDGMVLSLARALEERDRYTEGHGERVSALAVRVGQRLELAPAQLRTLRLGGILHDIGKIGVSDTVLHKSERLTPDEMDLMKLHPVIGYQILLPLRSFSQVLPIVRWHHERCDGSGYPDGLSDTSISIEVRIMAVMDVYDALTTDRPYRAALAREDALTILDQQAARGLIDGQVVQELAAVVREPEPGTA